MVERGRGHFMITASAAGLLTEMDTAPYAVTKHGSVALAEWLAIRYGDAGVGFSCLCPQGVRTRDDRRPRRGLRRRWRPARLSNRARSPTPWWRPSPTGGSSSCPTPRWPSSNSAAPGDRDRWLTGMRRIRGPSLRH